MNRASKKVLVLASASPRRKQLLRLAGVPFRVKPSRVEERRKPRESPRAFTLRAALLKAEAVAAGCPPGTWVLAADTTVVVDGAILGKPANRRQAARMLQRLSSRSHQVLTAVVLLQAGFSRRRSLLSRTKVTFRPLSRAIIDGYLKTKEPLDKAGAYGIQGRAAMLVSSIDGSYTNVVGLPLCETVSLLEKVGAFRPFAS